VIVNVGLGPTISIKYTFSSTIRMSLEKILKRPAVPKASYRTLLIKTPPAEGTLYHLARVRRRCPTLRRHAEIGAAFSRLPGVGIGLPWSARKLNPDAYKTALALSGVGAGQAKSRSRALEVSAVSRRLSLSHEHAAAGRLHGRDRETVPRSCAPPRLRADLRAPGRALVLPCDLGVTQVQLRKE